MKREERVLYNRKIKLMQMLEDHPLNFTVPADSQSLVEKQIDQLLTKNTARDVYFFLKAISK